jgi:hypothetical protein
MDRMDGKVGGWMDEWMDGWKDWWMDGWVDGMEGRFSPYGFPCLQAASDASWSSGSCSALQDSW